MQFSCKECHEVINPCKELKPCCQNELDAIEAAIHTAIIKMIEGMGEELYSEFGPFTPVTQEDREAIYMMTRISDFADKLNDWEMEFLDSIAERDNLTAKQRACFEKLCGRVLV